MAQPDFFRGPRSPWNRGRLVGPKPPLKPRHIWAIRQQLKNGKRVRDLALFNCAIDAKLRGCDLVKLRVSDIAMGSAVRSPSIIVQQKTGRPVPFEISEPTREALTAWLSRCGRRADDWLFPSRSKVGGHKAQSATSGSRWTMPSSCPSKPRSEVPSKSTGDQLVGASKRPLSARTGTSAIGAQLTSSWAAKPFRKRLGESSAG